MAFLGMLSKATSLTDIIFVSLTLFKSYSVRGIYTSTDTNGMIETWYNQTISIHQLNILGRARIGQSLI